MIRSPAEIFDRWMNYGSRYAVYPSLRDSSLAFASGPLMPEGPILHDYSGQTAGAAWSVGAEDVPKYVQGSVRGQSFLAISFDQVNDYADAGNPSGIFDFAANDSFSFGCWFKRLNTTSLESVLSKEDGDRPTWGLLLRGDITGKLQSGFQATAGDGPVLESSADLDDGAWHCANTVVDRVTHVATLYVDGNANSSGAIPAAASYAELATKLLVACRKQSAPDRFFGGNCVATCIYRKALTQFDIATLARHPLAAYEVNVPRYWMFPTTAAASPWLYARRPSRMIGSGLGV